MKKLILISLPITLFLINCGGGQKDNNSKDDIFKKSIKKQISSGDINSSDIEYFDESTRLYSNFKYGISYKEIRGWEIDYGVGQYTIYRAVQRDSAYTFVIDVIEVNIDNKDNLDIHEVVDEYGIEAYESNLKNMMSTNANAEILSMTSNKIYFRNFAAMKTLFTQNVKEGFDEMIFTGALIQIQRENLMISCSLFAPQFLYQENEQSLNEIFEYIHLLNIKKP